MRTALFSILALISLTLAILQLSRGGLDRIVGRIPFAVNEHPFKLPVEAATQISITKGTTKLEAKRLPSGVYWATSPYNDRIDPRASNAILQFTSGTSVVDTIPLKSATRIKEFGLTSDAILIDIKKSNGKSLAKYSLGKPSPLKLPIPDSDELDATSYLRSFSHSREDEILVVSGAIYPLFNNNLLYLRDHHPFLLNPKAISEIHLSHSGSDIILQRNSENSPWQISKPMQLNTEQPAIAQLFISLAELTANQIKNPDELTLPEVAPEQLRKVSLFYFDKSDPTILTIYPPNSPNDTNVLATISDRKAVFSLPRKTVDNLPGTEAIPFNINSLRSRKLISFDAKSLRGIKIQSPNNLIVLTHPEPSSAWLASIDHSLLAPPNELTLYNLLKTLLTSDIAGFASDVGGDLASFGLDNPICSLEFAFFDSTSKTIQFSQSPEGKIYAKIVGEPIIYSISDSYFSKIAHLPHQWRNTKIFDFSPSEITSITLASANKPALKLSYDYLDDSCKAHLLPLEEGTEAIDITEKLNLNRAQHLLKTICKLKANSWLPSNSKAIKKALADPPIAITIATGDVTNPSAKRTYTTLFIAPAGNMATCRVFYAKLSHSPECFLLTRDQLKTLTANLLEDPE